MKDFDSDTFVVETLVMVAEDDAFAKEALAAARDVGGICNKEFVERGEASLVEETLVETTPDAGIFGFVAFAGSPLDTAGVFGLFGAPGVLDLNGLLPVTPGLAGVPGVLGLEIFGVWGLFGDVSEFSKFLEVTKCDCVALAPKVVIALALFLLRVWETITLLVLLLVPFPGNCWTPCFEGKPE